MNNKCLYCYEEIDSFESQTDAGLQGYHQRCCKRFFGRTSPPRLDFTEDQILELAEQVIKSQKTVTGVQPKLSLGLSDGTGQHNRFTIVGLWGGYILKPQTEMYPNLPENEDLTMHLAGISNIKTVEHSLIKLKSGQIAYITKRIDRMNGSKIHMEDMCQLTERLTEYKYKGSYEQIAKVIKRYTANPGLDVVNFYELVLFSFLTGNNDMHLKNFSLLKDSPRYNLCPSYDLLASELVIKGDDDDLALTLNGKKKKINRNDFEIATKRSGMGQKAIENIFIKFAKLLPKWEKFIDQSFLPKTSRDAYKGMVHKKANQLNI